MTPAVTVECVDLSAADPRWTAVLPVLQELRPHLSEALLRQIRADGDAPAFTALFDADGACLAVAGWRVVGTTTNASGRRLFVDDLVTTAERRGRGWGGYLLGVLEQRGRDAGCAVLELDSGVQRTAAHRFYLDRGFQVTCRHFGKQLDEAG